MSADAPTPPSDRPLDELGARLQAALGEDYAVEGQLAVLVVGSAILITWPTVPWNLIWGGAIALMLAAPFLLFPMSRITWLAFDLIFRPKHESHYR